MGEDQRCAVHCGRPPGGGAGGRVGQLIPQRSLAAMAGAGRPGDGNSRLPSRRSVGCVRATALAVQTWMIARGRAARSTRCNYSLRMRDCARRAARNANWDRRTRRGQCAPARSQHKCTGSPPPPATAVLRPWRKVKGQRWAARQLRAGMPVPTCTNHHVGTTSAAPPRPRCPRHSQAIWKGTAFWVFWGLAAVAFMQFLSKMHGRRAERAGGGQRGLA